MIFTLSVGIVYAQRYMPINKILHANTTTRYTYYTNMHNKQQLSTDLS